MPSVNPKSREPVVGIYSTTTGILSSTQTGEVGNSNTATLSVKPLLTVSAAAGDKGYDGTTAVSVTLSDDRVAGDSLTVTYTGAAFDNPTAGGGKTVNVSGISISGTDAGNYVLANTTATTSGVITQAPLAIEAKDATKSFGGPRPSFIVTYSGFVNGDTESVLGGTLAFATSASPTSPVGSYEVTPGGLTSTNYAITFQKGTLVVNSSNTSTTLQVSTRTVTSGQSLTLTATVNAAVTGASGTVTFMDGIVAIGRLPVVGEQAVLTVSDLTLGSHSLSAVYSGDSRFATSASSPADVTVLPLYKSYLPALER